MYLVRQTAEAEKGYTVLSRNIAQKGLENNIYRCGSHALTMRIAPSWNGWLRTARVERKFEQLCNINVSVLSIALPTSSLTSRAYYLLLA